MVNFIAVTASNGARLKKGARACVEQWRPFMEDGHLGVDEDGPVVTVEVEAADVVPASGLDRRPPDY